jgi:PAS domain S-box-containing protein
MNDAKELRRRRRAERATRRLETSAASKSATPSEPPVEEELHPSRVELMAILGAVAEGVTVQDVSGQLMYANDAAARLSGYASVEAMLAASGAEVLRQFVLLDEQGHPFSPERLPGRRVLRGEEAPEALVRFRVMLTGEERWSVVDATPIRDAEGRVVFAVNLFRDITERKHAEDAARFLAAASRMLGESLDYDRTLQQVADLAVPTLADWCVVDIVEERQVRRLALAHVDPEKVAMARELQQRYPEDPQASIGVPHVLLTGRPEMLTEITDAMLEAGARDAEHLRLLRELQLRSYVIVPLLARGRTLGALTLVAAESGRRYGPADLALAEELAGRAALALDNARLYLEAQQRADAHVLLNAALRETVGERDEAVARLQEALRTREEFLASAAHDLKNPLAAIKARVQLLERRARSGSVQDASRLPEELRRIDTTVTRAAALVEELLDLTQLQMGRSLELDRAPTDLIAVVREVVAEHQQLSARHSLRVETSEPDLVGDWDKRRLMRVLGNLLENAMKYSPGGGPIVVSVRRDADGLEEQAMLAVRDPGIGIPAEDVPTIFERFRRAANVRGRIAGAGIGLASARFIVESHGGTIAVESHEGHGSTFMVRLPLLASAVDAGAQSVAGSSG